MVKDINTHALSISMVIFRYGRIDGYGDATHGYGYNHLYKPLYGAPKHGHGHHHGVVGSGKGHPAPGPFNHGGFGGPHLGVGGPHHLRALHGDGHHGNVPYAHLGGYQGYGFGRY